MQAVIETKNGSRYTLSQAGVGFSVSGGDSTLAGSLARMASVAAADYSPAFGSRFAYIASEVARGVGGSVVRLEGVTQDPPGTVH